MGTTTFCIRGEHLECPDSERDTLVCDCVCHLTDIQVSTSTEKVEIDKYDVEKGLARFSAWLEEQTQDG